MKIPYDFANFCVSITKYSTISISRNSDEYEKQYLFFFLIEMMFSNKMSGRKTNKNKNFILIGFFFCICTNFVNSWKKDQYSPNLNNMKCITVYVRVDQKLKTITICINLKIHPILCTLFCLQRILSSNHVKNVCFNH